MTTIDTRGSYCLPGESEYPSNPGEDEGRLFPKVNLNFVAWLW
ncbi:hypothetical protein [Coleofasciculus sp. LEGE 07092]|nr:hypothetical protein [Coleofasciculus sp. LEGE 07092]